MKLITVICTALMAFSLTACAQKLEKKWHGCTSLLNCLTNIGLNSRVQAIRRLQEHPIFSFQLLNRRVYLSHHAEMVGIFEAAEIACQEFNYSLPFF